MMRTMDWVEPEMNEPKELRTLGWTDPETGQRREIQTQRRKVRELYAEAAIEQRANIAQTFRESRTNHLQLSTDRDWLLDVVRFVATQKGLK